MFEPDVELVDGNGRFEAPERPLTCPADVAASLAAGNLFVTAVDRDMLAELGYPTPADAARACSGGTIVEVASGWKVVCDGRTWMLNRQATNVDVVVDDLGRPLWWTSEGMPPTVDKVTSKLKYMFTDVTFADWVRARDDVTFTVLEGGRLAVRTRWLEAIVAGVAGTVIFVRRNVVAFMAEQLQAGNFRLGARADVFAHTRVGDDRFNSWLIDVVDSMDAGSWNLVEGSTSCWYAVNGRERLTVELKRDRVTLKNVCDLTDDGSAPIGDVDVLRYHLRVIPPIVSGERRRLLADGMTSRKFLELFAAAPAVFDDGCWWVLCPGAVAQLSDNAVMVVAVHLFDSEVVQSLFARGLFAPAAAA